MKMRRLVRRASFTFLVLAGVGLWPAFAQTIPGNAAPQQRAVAAPQATDLPRVELLILARCGSNPLTAPYPIAVTWNKGAVTLSGVVGTKQVHDVAVRLAIASGKPIRDNLVIDTGIAHAAAMMSASLGPAAGVGGFARVGGTSPVYLPAAADGQAG